MPVGQGCLSRRRVIDPVPVQVMEFEDLQKFTKEKWAEPRESADLQNQDDEEREMSEDEFRQNQIGKVENLFKDTWAQDVGPKIKAATINKLLDLGRVDVVKQIHKFDDVSGLVDAETLKKVLG